MTLINADGLLANDRRPSAAGTRTTGRISRRLVNIEPVSEFKQSDAVQRAWANLERRARRIKIVAVISFLLLLGMVILWLTR